MEDHGLVRPDMREIVGQPFRRSVSYPVTASDIRRWAIAVHYPQAPPARYRGADPRAPLDFNPFAWGAAESLPTGREIEVDAAFARTGAVEHHLGVVPPDLRRVVNGGMSVSYEDVGIREGDVVSTESFVAEYSERQGRLGAMLMTRVTTVWTNQRGEKIKSSDMTLIRY